MAITFTNLGASANPDLTDNIDRTSYVNTSWTPPTSGLIILFVYSCKATAADPINTVTGNSLTWSIITTATFGTSAIKRLTLVAANAAGSTTGATTVDFNALTQLACNMSFFQVDGAAMTNGVSTAFVQTPVVNSGAAATSGSITLAAPAHPDNRPISCFGQVANEAITNRANWTEMDDIGGTAPVRGLETQVRSDVFETTGSATWTTSTVWGAIAAEIRASAIPDIIRARR